MAIRQLNESNIKAPIKIVGGLGGIVKIEDAFLKRLNESKGIITPLSFNFKDIAGEYTVPHGKRKWELYKECYQRIGVVANAIDNTANFAMQSGYELEGSDIDKKRVLEWMDKNNFNQIMLNIMKQMQTFGNAYLEITDMPKLLPVETMFVIVRKGDKDDGNIIGYKQVLSHGREIRFEPSEIIHFKWREMSDFYGNSDIEPNIGVLTKLLNFQEDVGEIMHNYAHPIIHFLLGSDESPPKDQDITDFIELRNELKTGQDLVTSYNVKHEVISADLRMIQIDGMIKHMENQLIAGLQVPEIFIRGGQTSNKATADTELQAFDRRVKAIREVFAKKMHDEYFVPKLQADVTISYYEMSTESELLKSQMMTNYVNAGVPTKVALMMTGYGSWVDDFEREDKIRQEKQEKMQKQQNQLNIAQNPDKPAKPAQTTKPKEQDYQNQKDWLEALERWNNINES